MNSINDSEKQCVSLSQNNRSHTTKKIIIFGNSGSGKSTLAKKIAAQYQLAHLDLDTLAWLATLPPTRQALDVSTLKIDAFIANNTSWLIEGCYGDLLAHAIKECNEIIFLDLPVSLCVENAQGRPWEPHKYASKALQDENLAMLLNWIEQYDVRSDDFSRLVHQALFVGFSGKKTRFIDNQ